MIFRLAPLSDNITRYFSDTITAVAYLGGENKYITEH